jgi:hypothetical protein
MMAIKRLSVQKLTGYENWEAVWTSRMLVIRIYQHKARNQMEHKKARRRCAGWGAMHDGLRTDWPQGEDRMCASSRHCFRVDIFLVILSNVNLPPEHFIVVLSCKRWSLATVEVVAYQMRHVYVAGFFLSNKLVWAAATYLAFRDSSHSRRQL